MQEIKPAAGNNSRWLWEFSRRMEYSQVLLGVDNAMSVYIARCPRLKYLENRRVEYFTGNFVSNAVCYTQVAGKICTVFN
jgi:hypothetical protein